MVDFVTLSCPTCSGKLEITQDINRFACNHCGNEHIVMRRGGVVAISAVEETLEKIDRSTDKTASELAIKRLSEEIPRLETELREITGKHAESLYFQFLDFQGKKGLSGLFSNNKTIMKVVKGLTVEEFPELINHMKAKLGKLNKPQQEHSRQVIDGAQRILFLKLEIPKKYASLKRHKSIVDS